MSNRAGSKSTGGGSKKEPDGELDAGYGVEFMGLLRPDMNWIGLSVLESIPRTQALLSRFDKQNKAKLIQLEQTKQQQQRQHQQQQKQKKPHGAKAAANATEKAAIGGKGEAGPEQGKDDLEALRYWLQTTCKEQAHGKEKEKEEEGKEESSNSSSSNSDEAKWVFNALAQEDRGNGLVARADIAEGEEVISIPRVAMLSAKFGRGPVPEIAVLIDEFEDNSVLQLTMVVAYHMINASTSFFAPYLRVLPTVYSIPLFWDASIFSSLQHAHYTMSRAAMSVRAAVLHYWRAYQTLKHMRIASMPAYALTWDLFRRAMSAVVTRQNNIPVFSSPSPSSSPLPSASSKEAAAAAAAAASSTTSESTVEAQEAATGAAAAEPLGVQVLALVPGWDMINHEQGAAMTTFFNQETDSLVYPAMRAFAQGQEITMCYGQRGSELFLIYNGFCLPNNHNDSLEVPIVLVQDEMARVREGIVRTCAANEQDSLSKSENKVDGGVAMVTMRKQRPIPKVAWFAAIASVMTKAEAAAVIRSGAQTTQELLAIEAISVDTKCKAKEVLRRAFSDMIGGLCMALEATAEPSTAAAAEAITPPPPPAVAAAEKEEIATTQTQTQKAKAKKTAKKDAAYDATTTATAEAEAAASNASTASPFPFRALVLQSCRHHFQGQIDVITSACSELDGHVFE